MYKMPKTNVYADSYLVILNEQESAVKQCGIENGNSAEGTDKIQGGQHETRSTR